ncbi:probable regulator Ustilago maydis 1 protein (Rum1) [Melanopsichium pennsylvanicum]|uniref:Regulator Ustilago maydis 1 protein (Rum1) n=2 Tax=Melanopsichium pennsylvanicum TaxID=63383 RepID=A0A077R3M1_9BASI|nr:regulator Ustilago maydis 1 protein (Rum1) [Melanopsichium pennsylvanicum 4]SNX84289.1 probable regulator Ustilago maydis 1 protein (Rum1) [Melanopsichium pennsylvanicum]
MTTIKQGFQPDTPQRIIVKSVNGHEPIKAEPASSSLPHTISSTIATPLSSPTKSNLPSSPAKSPGRPRRVEPILVSSSDFGPSAGGESDDETGDADSELTKGATAKRLSRKSKADAMSAISGKDVAPSNAPVACTSAPSGNVPNATPGNPARHPARKLFQHQPFPPLAFDYDQGSSAASTSSQPAIPTSSGTPRNPPPRVRPRLFELEEAPTFYPTPEEFADPMRYIAWIADPQGGNGKASGIVKIVPPEGWNPECVLDEQTFRFRTRVQRLNSLSADARASQNYQEQLQKFHAQQGRKRVSVPVIDGRSVDLYQLKLVISSLGGYDAVCRGRRWSDATRKIGYTDKDSAQLSTQVKAAYSRIVLPFEEFLAKAKEQSRSNGASISPHLAQNATMGGTASHEGQESGLPNASMSPSLDASSSGDRAAHSNTPEPLFAPGAAELLANATPMVESATQSPSGVASTRRSARKRSEATSTPVSSSRNPLQLVSSPATPVAARRRKGVSPHVEADPHVRTQAGEEQMCEICLRGEDGLNMLLCDECNRGYHMYCLQPALTSVPKSQWFCPPCLVGTGHDFGFDDGETHSLYTFWQRAEAFKREWWSKRPERLWKPDYAHLHDGLLTNGLARRVHGTDLIVSEDDVEREFWRLVHSQSEEVEVEYGADVHSTTHGSALPTQETHPLSPYSRDKWNLNNLPILPGSLLQYIKSDISGMTVPWIYVGMIFSTFCWHNEDHYTYSINYQHWGETKTWYGIPGEDAEKFENAMRKAAPDLFETLPDLLFHLTTMMSPEKLKKEGVRVVACDQRANEFVVTFPKAYHSGFNHGLNLNEAVNFALPDWIFDDLESVRRYQRFRKPAVFSHDQLLITVSQQSQTIETAVWLEAAMQEMVDREIAKRNALREIIPNLKEELYEEDVAESQYLCTHCTIFCYLGQLTSPKTDGVACLEHGFEVCNADAPVKWTLKLRFSDEQLRAILAKVCEKAAVPRNWIQRLKKTLALGPSPPLKTLRSLLHEGEKIAYSLEPLQDLKTFVACANSWVDRANVFLIRKLHKRRGEPAAAPAGRGRRSKGGTTGEDSLARRASMDITADDADSCADRSPEALYALLGELDSLHFDAPEIASLRSLVQELEEFIARANDILGQHDRDRVSLKDCQSVFTLGSSLNVDAPQVKELSDYIDRRKWIQEVAEARDTYLYYHEVQELLQRAESCGLGDHELRRDLEQKRDAGQRWTERAREALGGTEPMTVALLEELSESSSEIPVVLEVAQDVSNALTKAKEIQRTVQTLYRSLQPGAQGNAGADADGDLSMISVSEISEAADRMALLPDARRAIRAVKANKLELEHAQDIEKAITTYDAWRSTFNQIMQTIAAGSRRLTDTDRDAELDRIMEKVENSTDPSDDQPKASLRNCICRSSNPISVPSSSTAECSHCHIKYHLSCIKVRSSEVSRAENGWTCPFCPWYGNTATLKHRKAVSVAELSKLVYDQDHRRDQFKFLPIEWDAIEEIVAKVKRFETAAKRMIKTLSLMRCDQKQAILAHWLRRTIGCPVDLLGPEKVNMLDLISETLLGLGPVESEGRVAQIHESMQTDTSSRSEDRGKTTPAQTWSGAMARADRGSGSPANLDDRKRKAKRGKRAKLLFREEIGIGAYRDRQPIYCLCHEPESGRMIACDKCMLWFHTHCVRLDNPDNLGDEAWICPMCCIKAERKYPQAEVRVKDIGVTDPDLWLDIRATLRSLEKPVSKVQSWSSREDKRIVLHLDKFTPAIHAEEVHSQINKRARLESDTPSKARASLGRSDSISTPAKDNGAMPYAPAPVPSEAARGFVPAASTPAGPSQPAAEIPPARPTRNDEPIAAASPPQHESKTGPSPGGPSFEWTQAARRRHADGMDNLYRRGITDTMLMRFYVGWNGRQLIHPMRDPSGTNIVEISLGEAIRLQPDDPEGARVIRAALERYNARLDRAAAAQANPQRAYAPEMDDLMHSRTPYGREDARYGSQRHEPPTVPSNGSRFDLRSPGMVPSHPAEDRDCERDLCFGDSVFRPLRSPATIAARISGTSPALRSNVAREFMPTYARSPVGHNMMGSNGTVPAAESPYASAAEPGRFPSSHSMHRGTDRGLPYRGNPISDLDGYRAPPPMPTYTSGKPDPSTHGSAYGSLPLDPAMMADDAAQVVPDLSTSPVPFATAAQRQTDAGKSPKPGSKDTAESAKTSTGGRMKQEDEEQGEELESVREQARQMARRMRPDASEAEIERLVKNFVGDDDV